MKALVYVARHLETPVMIDKYIGITTNYLKELGHEAAICHDLDCALLEIVDADIYLGWHFPKELFPVTKKLKWIQFGSAGIDHTLFPELLESEIILTTVSGIHPVPVAEHVMGLMLALTRRLYIAIEQQTRSEWNRKQISHTSEELSGKTVGIIGLGKIGLHIARLCKSFGMTVIGTKGNVGDPLPNVDVALPPSGLDDVLQPSDVLVLVVPLTTGTRALIGERELDLMKPGSFIVNVARGQMIDHDALIKKLQSGHISGAALDVFPEEPLPPDSPIWHAPNLIVTPHTGGSTPSYPERASEIFKANLDAFLSGKPMKNVFDRKRGY